MFRHSLGESGECSGERIRFHREKGNMPAAVVTPFSAGKIFSISRCDLPAQEIDLLDQISIVPKACRADSHFQRIDRFIVSGQEGFISTGVQALNST